MEPALKLTVLTKDKDMAKEILPECEKEYEELMQKETSREYKCKLELDEEKTLQAEDLGGVILVTGDGRIVCHNTIASKLKLGYEELLPEIRALLFPAKK